MRRIVIGLSLVTVSGFSTAAAPAPAAAPKGSTFLACTGAQPWWEGSWAVAAQGTHNDQAKTTIRLNADKTTATVMLVSLGEQVFNIKSNDEFYYGGKAMNQPALDGVISSASISINRITGSTSISFEVENSPKDGGRWAFSGWCAPATAQF